MGAEFERDPLEWGIVTYCRGELGRARDFFRQAIVAEPTNERAWIWLARVAETATEQICCLRRILEINPKNATAKILLGQLEDAEEPFKAATNPLHRGLPE